MTTYVCMEPDTEITIEFQNLINKLVFIGVCVSSLALLDQSGKRFCPNQYWFQIPARYSGWLRTS